MAGNYPEYRDWSIPAVSLLQGVVEREDGRVWDILLSNSTQVEQYLARLGLQLIIDEPEGLAFVRQFPEEETPDGYEKIPRLFRASRLSFGQTVLSVLLREALRRFEEEQTLDARCVVEEAELLESWKTFFPDQKDEVRLQRDLRASLNKLDELGFVRRFGQESGSWEVRRVLKARLTADILEQLHEQLLLAIHRKQATNSRSDEN